MSGKPIRVLHVLATLNIGGVETWLMHVLRHIDRERFQLDFCLLGAEKGVFSSEAEQLGARVIHCPAQPRVWSLGRRFRRILREGKYDVVHSHLYDFSGAVLRWAHAQGVPTRIAHTHSARRHEDATFARKSFRRVMVRWIGSHATHALAASRDAARSLHGDGWQSNGRLRVLYYGIDLTPFSQPVNRAEVRRELGIPADARVVGHVGRFDFPKNHGFLLDVAAEVLRHRKSVHFLLVGDGPMKGEMEKKAANSRLAAIVHFLGVRRDVPRLMKGAMDAFLLPSLWEGFPIAFLEAQSACLPCIVSEAVPEDVALDGCVVRRIRLADGPQTWAQVLCGILGCPLPQGAVPFKENPFSIDRCVRELGQLYGR